MTVVLKVKSHHELLTHRQAGRSRFYAFIVTPRSSCTLQPAALSSRIAAGKLVS